MPAIKPPPYAEYRQAIIEAGIKIVETAGYSPEGHLPEFHAAGVTVIHKVTSIRHTLKAQALGVDVISIDGFECVERIASEAVGLIELRLAGTIGKGVM